MIFLFVRRTSEPCWFESSARQPFPSGRDVFASLFESSEQQPFSSGRDVFASLFESFERQPFSFGYDTSAGYSVPAMPSEFLELLGSFVHAQSFH